MFRYLIILLILMIPMFLAPAMLSAHGGGLDSSGGHYEKSTGIWHSHEDKSTSLKPKTEIYWRNSPTHRIKIKIDVAKAKVTGRWEFIRKNPGYEAEPLSEVETFTSIRNGKKTLLVIKGDNVITREVTAIEKTKTTTDPSVKDSTVVADASETKASETKANQTKATKETTQNPNTTTEKKWNLFLWILPVIIIAIALSRSRHQ